MSESVYKWREIIAIADEWRTCLGVVVVGRLIDFRPFSIELIGPNRFRELTHQLIAAGTDRGLDVMPLHALLRLSEVNTLPEAAWDCVSNLYAIAAKEGRIAQDTPKISAGEEARKILPSVRTLPLPEETKPLFSRAVTLVQQRSHDFAAVGQWLGEFYSEGKLRELCERKYRNDSAYRLRLLRLNGSGNLALSTHKRRLALQRGRTRDELMHQTIEECHLRGYRLNGNQLVGRTNPNDYPDEKKVDESNYEVVWQDEDERFRRRFRQMQAERKWGRIQENRKEADYRRRFQPHTAGQKESKLDQNDHPERPSWRLEQAVRDIIAAGYTADAPPEHAEQSRKIVGLAALLVWPELLPMLGELGAWEWESRFLPVGKQAHWIDKMLALDPKEAKAGPHEIRPTVLNPRSVGREEVLFHRMPGEQRDLWNKWGDLSSFCSLLSVAVDELEANSIETTNPEVGRQPIVETIPSKSAPSPVSERPIDGPAAPNLLWFNGKSTTIEPIPWRLLDYAWRHRTAKEADVVDGVWGHDDAASLETDGPVKSAMKKANRALDEVSCPLHLGRKNGFITLA